jgi:prefoldin subunit 5
MIPLTYSEDLSHKLKALHATQGKQETMIELGAGVYADAHVFV